MATAKPCIDQYIDDYDLEMIQVCDPHEQHDFDGWLLRHSCEQLVDVHSSLKLRWEIIHWLFTVPFVSREYADIRLLRVLEALVERFKDSVHSDPEAFDSSTCFSVDVPSLGLTEVPFRVTSEFRIAPHPYSFEAVCIRRQVDPEELRPHIEYVMRQKGVFKLIDENEMAVRAKRQASGYEQQDLVGPVDYSDLKIFIPPIAVPGLVRQKSVANGADSQVISETQDLFA